MKKNGLIVFLLIFLTTSIPGFSQGKTNTEESKFFNNSAYSKAKLTYKIIDVGNSTFGYDIYVDGNIMIHQNNIPAVPGNNGFTTKVKAKKVARFVISKIKAGEMPPAVRIEELEKLKAI